MLHYMRPPDMLHSGSSSLHCTSASAPLPYLLPPVDAPEPSGHGLPLATSHITPPLPGAGSRSERWDRQRLLSPGLGAWGLQVNPSGAAHVPCDNCHIEDPPVVSLPSSLQEEMCYKLSSTIGLRSSMLLPSHFPIHPCR